MQTSGVDTPLSQACWRVQDLDRLLETFGERSVAIGKPAGNTGSWIEASAKTLGLDCRPVELWGYQVEDRLRAASPALVSLPGGRYVGLLGLKRDRAALLAPDGRRVHCTLEQLRYAVTADLEAKYGRETDELLESANLPVNRREKARRALLRERSRFERVGVLYELRTPAGSSFLEQMRSAGLTRRLLLLFGAHLAEYGIWLVSWYVIGSQALSGRLDRSWLYLWVLLLMMIVPLRAFSAWSQGLLALGAGGLLRQRLLVGALELEPEEVRHEGAGRFLGRAIEAESVESLALSGGLNSALALLEIIIASSVLAFGVTPGLLFSVLAVVMAGVACLAVRYFRLRSEWTAARLSLTHDLVENMTGHRTRLAQQPPADWHTEEDVSLNHYAEQSRRMDGCAAILSGIAPRAWLLGALTATTPAFLTAGGDAAPLAVTLGGILLIWAALGRLAAGVAHLSGAAIAWKQVAPLFNAARREISKHSGAVVTAAPHSEGAILDARNLEFRYNQGGRTVFSNVQIQVRAGDWMLLEGESGGGKSTLVSILSGLRKQTSGLLLAAGLDLATLGPSNWRSRVASAPQYHENHVLTGPLAYNLLMGRSWPALPEDMEEARTVAEELGLGPLLERMPGGMMQMVGETGWQLSQGERSRVFMARALLQHAPMVILDESFAALDPATQRQALECALRRAKTLLVVAHP